MSAFTNTTFLEMLNNSFPNTIEHSEEKYHLLNIVIPKDKNVEIIDFLQKEPLWNISFLTDLCAVHFPGQLGKELAIIYHLHSLPNNFRVRIKCYLDIKNPEIATLTSVYSSANWMERETYDFYGVIFKGHPDLRRILNVDEMDYFPLRKEYALEDETRDDKDDRFFGR